MPLTLIALSEFDQAHPTTASPRGRVHRNPDTQISCAVQSTAGSTFLLGSPKAPVSTT